MMTLRLSCLRENLDAEKMNSATVASSSTSSSFLFALLQLL
jgi:hypothetical protein